MNGPLGVERRKSGRKGMGGELLWLLMSRMGDGEIGWEKWIVEVGKYEEEGDHILGDERRTEKEEEEEMSPKEQPPKVANIFNCAAVRLISPSPCWAMNGEEQPNQRIKN
jgi:hypothetical protein